MEGQFDCHLCNSISRVSDQNGISLQQYNIIIIIIIIIIIAFKDAIRDFFTISSLCHEPSPTRTFKWPGCNCVQIMCNTSSTYYMQRVACHVIQRDSPAIKFDKV